MKAFDNLKIESGFSLAIAPNIDDKPWMVSRPKVSEPELRVICHNIWPPPTKYPQYPQYCVHNIWPQATHPPTKPVLILLQILSLIDSDHRGGAPQFDISSGICQLSKQFSFEAAKCESGQIRRQKDVIWRGREDGNVRYYVISQISKLPVATFQATFGEDVKWVARRNVQNMTALGNTC